MLALQKLRFRLLCWLMAWMTLWTPSVVVWAQQPEPSRDLHLRYLVRDAAAIVSLRPRQLLTCEATEMLPIEVLTAASLKELGFNPLKIKSVLLSAIPPLAGAPIYSVVVELTERIDLATLSPKLTQHTISIDREGQTYLQSQHPALPSFYWVGETTLLIAPETTLQQLLSSKPKELDEFARELSVGSPDDLLLLVNVAMLRPLINMGLMQVAGNVPPELNGLLELPNHLEQVRIKFSVSGAGPLELSCEAVDDAAANRIQTLIEQSRGYYRESVAAEATRLLASEDPVEQAMGHYTNRITPTWIERFTPTRNQNRFTLFEIPAGENPLGGAVSVATIGVLVALLLPAVQAAREAARRNTSMTNLKRIMLSLHNFHDQSRTKKFPAHASYNEQQTPLLSWRVHVLPYLGEEALYEQFHLDEAWDSPHNRKLIPLMPEIYNDPSSGVPVDSGRTHYLAVIGKGLAFDGTERGKSFASFRDGTSNSIMIVQVNNEKAATWTKPEDWEWNEKAPLAGLVPGFHPGMFLAGFADAHVKSIGNDIDVEVFRHLLTIAGGEVVNIE